MGAAEKTARSDETRLAEWLRVCRPRQIGQVFTAPMALDADAAPLVERFGDHGVAYFALAPTLDTVLYRVTNVPSPSARWVVAPTDRCIGVADWCNGRCATYGYPRGDEVRAEVKRREGRRRLEEMTEALDAAVRKRRGLRGITAAELRARIARAREEAGDGQQG